MYKLLATICVLAFAATPCAAGTIELWDGVKLTDVAIGETKDGYLHFTHQSKARRIQLAKIKNLSRDDEGSAQIVRFVDYDNNGRKGKLLSISVKGEGKRMIRPLVRVLLCAKDKRDEFELYSYQNSRVYDPTNYGKLDEVATADFRERHYTINRADAIAFQVEVWQRGRLVASKGYGDSTAIPQEWYKKMPLKSTRSLKVAEDVKTKKDLQELVANEEDEDEGAPHEPGWKVSVVSTLPKPPSAQPWFKVSYQYVNRAENSAVEPKIVVYYVTKSKAGDLEIANVTVSSGGEKLVGSQGLFRGSAEKKIPGTVRLNAVEVKNEEGASQLVHWRVELLREDTILAVREKAGSMKKKLPKRWWE